MWHTLWGCGGVDKTDSALDKVRDQNTFGAARVSLVRLHWLGLETEVQTRKPGLGDMFYPIFLSPSSPAWLWERWV